MDQFFVVQNMLKVLIILDFVSDSIIRPSSSKVSHDAPDDLFSSLNGINEPKSYVSRASCEHLHPTDPVVQVAMGTYVIYRCIAISKTVIREKKEKARSKGIMGRSFYNSLCKCFGTKIYKL